MYITVNVILAVLFATLRIAGMTNLSYQFTVHFYMGGLLIAWFFLKREGKLDLAAFSIWSWWGLIAVELVMSAPKILHGLMVLWTRHSL